MSSAKFDMEILDSGDTLHVLMVYPRQRGGRFVEIGLEDVRASDGIRVSYDFDRDGYVIEQPISLDEPVTWKDTPGCNHEWRQCPVHDVRRESEGYVVFHKGTSLGPTESIFESVMASVGMTCRGCGCHVCSCHRPAIDTETRGSVIDIQMLNDRGPDPRRGASLDVRLRDEIDAIDFRLTRDQLNKWASLTGVEPHLDEDEEVLRRRIRERIRPWRDLSSTNEGEDTGITLSRSEVRDSYILRTAAINTKLVDTHGVERRVAWLLSQACEPFMYDAIMDASNVIVCSRDGYSYLTADGSMLTFVKDPGDSEERRCGLDDVIRAKAVQHGAYRLEPGALFAVDRGNADGTLSRSTLREHLVEDHGLSKRAARLIESHPETFPPKALMRAHEVRVFIPSSSDHTLCVIVDGEPMGQVSWE